MKLSEPISHFQYILSFFVCYNEIDETFTSLR